MAYTAFGLFVLHDEKTVKLSWYAYGTLETLVILSIIVSFNPGNRKTTDFYVGQHFFLYQKLGGY